MISVGIFNGYFPYALGESIARLKALGFTSVQLDLCFKDSNVLINNTNGYVLRFVPPLIVNEEEIDIVIKAVDEAMTKLGW